jgi:hypothetical protein
MIQDSLLGKHVEFLRRTMPGVLESGRPAFERVVADGYHTVIHLVPSSVHDQARRLLGGSYMQAVDPLLRDADRSRDHFVHWVFCMDREFTNLHLTFVPRQDQMSILPSILAVDLLTPTERASVGL